MSRQFTVAEIMTKVRVRGDYENSGFMTDAILIDFIDSAYAEVHDLLVTKWEGYYTTETTLSTVSGVETISLPSDFFKLLGIDIQEGSLWSRLFRFNLHERNSYQSGARGYRGSYFKYRVQGDSIKLIPTPTAVESIRLTYIPCASRLTLSTDIINGVNGWEELVALLALRRCQIREETSTSAVDNEISRQIKRLEVSADARDAGEPESLQDLAQYNDWDY